MINGQSILAIIPARGGSKRLPNKNIKILGDKPLIAWTIKAAKASIYIDRVVVSTDSDEIATVAKNWNAEVPFMRPTYLGTDKSPSEDVIEHTLNWIKDNEEKNYDYFLLLQPTSPFRASIHIDEAIEQIVSNTRADALVSVSENNLVSSESMIENKFRSLKTLNKLSGKKEHLSYVLNGAIYICKTNIFKKYHSFYKKNFITFVMDGKSSIDIDTEEDLLVAKDKIG